MFHLKTQYFCFEGVYEYLVLNLDKKWQKIPTRERAVAYRHTNDVIIFTLFN